MHLHDTIGSITDLWTCDPLLGHAMCCGLLYHNTSTVQILLPPGGIGGAGTFFLLYIIHDEPLKENITSWKGELHPYPVSMLFMGVHDYRHCRGDLFNPFGSMEALKQGKRESPHDLTGAIARELEQQRKR
jgi:hypothetical protein